MAYGVLETERFSQIHVVQCDVLLSKSGLGLNGAFRLLASASATCEQVEKVETLRAEARPTVLQTLGAVFVIDIFLFRIRKHIICLIQLLELLGDCREN